MPAATVYPAADFTWDAPLPSFLESGAEFSLAGMTEAAFDFSPYSVSFEPGGVPDSFLTSDGEVLSSDGEAISW